MELTNKKDLKGIKGWLLVLVIYLGISFTLYIFSHLYIGNIPNKWIFIISLALYIGALDELIRKKTGKPLWTKIHFIWRIIWTVLGIMGGMVISIPLIIQNILYIIWFIYLFKSKRVKVVYSK